VNEAPAGLIVPTWILAAANLYFGIDSSLPVGAATRAAAQLVGGAP
jgi:multicomponent Na+:H+ antiporter subunit D